MSARSRGATGLSGILLLDKPSGMTSHDVVTAVRRSTGEGRVGHAGTLDPAATGLLVVLVGPATRLEPYLSSADKSYEATIEFGTETDTDDADGTVTRQVPVAPETADPAWARNLLGTRVGESLQRPPAYSAIKVEGTVAHRAARSGAPLALAERPITISQADLVSIETDPVRWTVAFTVSKGTYVRSIARDLGVAAGSAAHLSSLRRTRSGTLELADAHSLDQISSAAAAGTLAHLMADPIDALGLPVIHVEAAAVADGRALEIAVPPSLDEGCRVAVADTGGRVLLALYRVRGDRLVAAAVFPGGVARGES